MTAYLRVTRQIVEVLATGTPDLRVTRQIVEVLAAPPQPQIRVTRQIVEAIGSPYTGGEIDVSAADALSLTQTAIASVGGLQQAADTLSMTQTVSVVHKRLLQPVADLLTLNQSLSTVFKLLNQPCLDTLSLGDTVTCLFRNLNPSVADTLAFTDTVGLAEASRYPSVADALSFTGTATVAVASLLPAVSDALTFADAANGTTHAPIAASAADILSLSQAVSYTAPIVLSVQDELAGSQPIYNPNTGITTLVGLQDAVQVAVIHNTPYAITDRLSFGEQVIGSVLHADAIACLASDALTLVDAALVNQVPIAADVLALTDAATATVEKVFHDALALADVATFNQVAVPAATDVLPIDHSVAFVLVRSDYRFIYTPFVGEGTAGNPTPPGPLVGPTASAARGCRFVYPPSSPTCSVWLRSPEFGNKDRLQFTRISRETRGGTLIVFADPMWPKIQTKVLTFTGLSQATAESLQDFIMQHLGLEVGFVDWEGRYWTGVITNTTDPVIQDGRGRLFTVSLEFECELATWTP